MIFHKKKKKKKKAEKVGRPEPPQPPRVRRPCSVKGFFLSESSAMLLWVSLVFQPLWHLCLQEIHKKIPMVIHYSLDSGWWLCSLQDLELPTRHLLSGLRPTQESTLVIFLLQHFSPSHLNTLSINLVNSKLFGVFVSRTSSLSTAALTSCFLFFLLSFTADGPLTSCFSVAPRFFKFWRTL